MRQTDRQTDSGRKKSCHCYCYCLPPNGNLFTHRLIRVKQSKINSEICNPLSVTGEREKKGRFHCRRFLDPNQKNRGKLMEKSQSVSMLCIHQSQLESASLSPARTATSLTSSLTLAWQRRAQYF